jgi:hypothetical protein
MLPEDYFLDRDDLKTAKLEWAAECANEPGVNTHLSMQQFTSLMRIELRKSVCLLP